MKNLTLAIYIGFTLSTNAAEIYVNNATGSDSFDGLTQKADGTKGPYATIAKAVERVAPGDTIHLEPTGKAYRESILFTNRGGEPGKPITVDGHGAWLTGSDHCDPAGWKPFPEGQPGTLTRGDLVDDGPWFALCVDGERTWSERDMDVLSPGEFCYVKNNRSIMLYFLPPDPKRLQDYVITVGTADGSTVTVDSTQWRASHSKNKSVRRNNCQNLKQAPKWIKIDGVDAPLTTAKNRLKPGQWCREEKTVYLRPPAGKTINDLKILSVPRPVGVGLLGKCGHFVFKNLNVVYVGNDGYNIHFGVKDATFLNCNAYYCFDEGFSSHDDCETTLDGAIYVYCDNGIANVNKCVSVTRNVLIDQSIHVGVLLTTKGSPKPDVVENTILIANPNQLSVTHANVDNLLIVGGKAGKPNSQAMNLGIDVKVKRATVVGCRGLLRVDAGSSASLDNCYFGPGQKGIHARTNDPAGVLAFRDIAFASDLTMEWGTKHPWKVKPLGEWFQSMGDKAKGCEVVDVNVQKDLEKGALPKAIHKGCSAELFTRYLDYLKKKDALLKKALDMAWGE